MPDSDDDVLARFVLGDRDAFESLFRQHQHEVYHWAVREIADALDVPIGTVKSRLFRATRQLRQELARMGVQQ